LSPFAGVIAPMHCTEGIGLSGAEDISEKTFWSQNMLSDQSNDDSSDYPVLIQFLEPN
jgi:hypothetical protein